MPLLGCFAEPANGVGFTFLNMPAGLIKNREVEHGLHITHFRRFRVEGKGFLIIYFAFFSLQNDALVGQFFFAAISVMTARLVLKTEVMQIQGLLVFQGSTSVTKILLDFEHPY